MCSKELKNFLITYFDGTIGTILNNINININNLIKTKSYNVLNSKKRVPSDGTNGVFYGTL
jgi:hypothetical protein